MAAATALCTRGDPREEAIELLLPPARRDGLTDNQAIRLIAAAYAPELTAKVTKESQASALARLAIESEAELFHDSAGETFVSFNVGDHRETWPTRSRSAKRWLIGLFYRERDAVPNASAIADAISLLEARGLYDGPQQEVHVRVAGDDQEIFIDLCDDGWRVISITSEGWTITERPGIKFRRPRGMLPLPVPQRGGTVDEFGPFLNLDLAGPEFVLVISWLVAAFRPTGPYPTLVLGGSHGAGKSYACKLIRSLVDPNVANLRAPPRSTHDLAIAATNSRVICLENLSELRPWLSDCLARLSTGSGFSTRELYSDSEESLFCACRPTLLNGIGEIVTAADLLDRALRITMAEIPRKRRILEKDLAADFEAASPRILGAILDGVVTALANLPTTTLSGLPRMADFAHFAVAAEPSMPWEPGSFIRAYAGCQQDSDAVAIESSPIGPIIRDDLKKPWEGTPADLLRELRRLDGQEPDRPIPRSWPADPTRLGNVLRRLIPNLSAIGIVITISRARERLVTITSDASDDSDASATQEKVA